MTIDSGGLSIMLSGLEESMSEWGRRRLGRYRRGQGRVYILGAAAMCMLCLPTTGQSQTFTKRQLQNIYSSHLSREGYRPETTSSGNVEFKREGKTYVIYVQETVPWMFRMDLIFTVSDKSAARRRKRLEATNFATAGTRAVKAYISPSSGDLVFSVQVYQQTPGDANKWLTRMFTALGSAYSKYQEH